MYMLTSIDLTSSSSLFVSVPRQIQDLEGRYTVVFKQQLSARQVVFCCSWYALGKSSQYV